MKVKVTTFVLGIAVFLVMIATVVSVNDRIFTFMDIPTLLFVAGIAAGHSPER